MYQYATHKTLQNQDALIITFFGFLVVLHWYTAIESGKAELRVRLHPCRSVYVAARQQRFRLTDFWQKVERLLAHAALEVFFARRIYGRI
jgi:hypothetical protein